MTDPLSVGIAYFNGASGLFVGIGLMVFLIVLSITWMKLFVPVKSYLYRKYLVNMYVSAKVREHAKKSNVDLEAEEARFFITMKKLSHKTHKELDDKIEQQLTEQIDKEIQEADTKKK